MTLFVVPPSGGRRRAKPNAVGTTNDRIRSRSVCLDKRQSQVDTLSDPCKVCRERGSASNRQILPSRRDPRRLPLAGEQLTVSFRLAHKGVFRHRISILDRSAVAYTKRQTERILDAMNGLNSSTVLWLLAAAQLFGVLSACATRLSEGSSRQALSHVLFLGMLPLVGAATIMAFAVGLGWWLISSATLAMMILTATCDLRNSRESATW
jgi:hypothetical protein